MDEHELGPLLTRAAESVPVPMQPPPGLAARVRRRRRRTAGAALGAAAAVVAVVGVTVPMVVSGERSESAPPATAAPSAPLVGVTWRMVSVDDGTQVIPIPASLGASLALSPDRRILLQDGTNAVSGRYTLTTDGFRATDVATTAVGYAGDNLSRNAAALAVSAIVFGDTSGTTIPDGARTRVVSVSRTKLVVTAAGLVATFTRGS